MSEETTEYLAVASYLTSEWPYGLPEHRLTEFLAAARIPHEELGGGVALATGERDYEIGFTATEAQKAMVVLYLRHNGVQGVWEILERGEEK